MTVCRSNRAGFVRGGWVQLCSGRNRRATPVWVTDSERAKLHFPATHLCVGAEAARCSNLPRNTATAIHSHHLPISCNSCTAAHKPTSALGQKRPSSSARTGALFSGSFTPCRQGRASSTDRRATNAAGLLSKQGSASNSHFTHGLRSQHSRKIRHSRCTQHAPAGPAWAFQRRSPPASSGHGAWAGRTHSCGTSW